MTTYSLAGAFEVGQASSPAPSSTSGARHCFPDGIPAMNAKAPPAGNPDAGPVVSGPDFGSPGGYEILGITVLQDYYVRIQYGGNTYWGTRTMGSLGGQSSEDDQRQRAAGQLHPRTLRRREHRRDERRIGQHADGPA